MCSESDFFFVLVCLFQIEAQGPREMSAITVQSLGTDGLPGSSPLVHGTTLKATIRTHWYKVMTTPGPPNTPEKRQEYKDGTPYWDSRFQNESFSYLEMYPGERFIQSCREWCRVEVISVRRVETPGFPGSYRIGPYSNGHYVMIETPHYWVMELGEIVHIHRNTLPPSLWDLRLFARKHKRNKGTEK